MKNPMTRGQVVSACLLVFLVAPACATSRPPEASTSQPAGETDRIPEQPGTIRKVSDFGFGIVPDSDPGTRYAPDALPEGFREDGLLVTFSGRLTAPPEGVRLWGTPLKLETIRRR